MPLIIYNVKNKIYNNLGCNEVRFKTLKSYFLNPFLNIFENF